MASKRYHQRVRLGDAFRAAQFPHGVPEPKVPDKVMEDYDNRMLIRWAIMRGLNAQKVCMLGCMCRLNYLSPLFVGIVMGLDTGGIEFEDTFFRATLLALRIF